MKKQQTEAQERFMTTDECAKILHCHAGNIRKAIKEGKLPAIMVKRAFLVERTDFENYIKSLRVIPSV